VSGADQPSCTAHVVLEDGSDGEAVRTQVVARLEADFDVQNVTIQTETVPCDAAEDLHP
jgi:cobalt-zinc-cadmium efflux system protein